MIDRTPVVSSPRPQANPVPVMTVTLVVLNLAVELVTLVFPDTRSVLSFYGDRVNFWTPLTCLFVHDNIVHLLGNMVFLATVGPLVEFNRGGFKFLVIYLMGGLIGVVAHSMATLARPEMAAIPLMGASAAAACCLGYASVVFFATKVPVAPRIAFPVWSVGLLWLGLQLVGAAIRTSGPEVGGVAFWAHAAGFALGLVLSLIFRVPREQRRRLGHEVLDRLNASDNQLVLAVADQHLKEHPTDAKAINEKTQALVNLGKPKEAAQCLIPLVLSGTEKERRDSILMLARLGKLDVLSAIERLKLSEQLEESDADLSVLLVDSVLTIGPGEPERPHALFELAQLLKESDPQRSRELVRELETRYDL
ncbi:MAG: rhomboid family intramembrane serine protease, partial [Armatimonadota bacterium]